VPAESDLRPAGDGLNRGPGHGRVRGSYLFIHLRADQPEWHAGASRRARELDLQISLLAEHEVTQVMTLLDAVAGHFRVAHQSEQEVQEANPIAVLEAIERQPSQQELAV
jgi:hypothetical protein